MNSSGKFISDVESSPSVKIEEIVKEESIVGSDAFENTLWSNTDVCPSPLLVLVPPFVEDGTSTRGLLEVVQEVDVLARTEGERSVKEREPELQHVKQEVDCALQTAQHAARSEADHGSSCTTAAVASVGPGQSRVPASLSNCVEPEWTPPVSSSEQVLRAALHEMRKEFSSISEDGLFQCICGRKYRHKSSLHKHIKSHLGGRANLLNSTRKLLDEMRLTVPSNQSAKTVVCALPNASSSKMQHSREESHAKVHNQRELNVQNCASEDKLASGAEVLVNPLNSNRTDPSCVEKSDPSGTAQHVSEVPVQRDSGVEHPRAPKSGFRCVCGETFCELLDLILHARSHTEEELNVSDVQEAQTANATYMEESAKNVCSSLPTETNPIDQRISQFTNIGDDDINVETLHSDDDDDDDGDDNGGTYMDSVSSNSLECAKSVCKGFHQCGVCDVTFEKFSDLMFHMRCHSTNQQCWETVEENAVGDVAILEKDKEEEDDALIERKVVDLPDCQSCECDTTFKEQRASISHTEAHVMVDSDKANSVGTGNVEEVGAVSVSAVNRLEMPQNDYKCGICDKSFERFPHLMSHMRSHSKRTSLKLKKKGPLPTTTERSSCSRTETDCEQRRPLAFPNAGTATVRARVSGSYTESCSHRASKRRSQIHCDCGRTFRSASALATHTNTHMSRGEYFCAICSKLFKQKSALSAHLVFHKYRNSYSCIYCQRDFVRYDDFVLHKQQYRSYVRCYICCKRFSHASCASSILKSKKKQYLCKVCDALMNATEQSEDVPSCGKDEGTNGAGGHQWSCSICREHFTDSNCLEQHRLTHLRGCEVHLVRLSSARSQAADAKALRKCRPKNFCCPCGRAFVWKSYLRNHLCQFQGHQCTFCKKAFRVRRSLMKHLACHTEALFKCNVCPQTFMYLAGLKSHQRYHAKKALASHLLEKQTKARQITSTLTNVRPKLGAGSLSRSNSGNRRANGKKQSLEAQSLCTEINKKFQVIVKLQKIKEITAKGPCTTAVRCHAQTDCVDGEINRIRTEEVGVSDVDNVKECHVGARKAKEMDLDERACLVGVVHATNEPGNEKPSSLPRTIEESVMGNGRDRTRSTLNIPHEAMNDNNVDAEDNAECVASDAADGRQTVELREGEAMICTDLKAMKQKSDCLSPVLDHEHPSSTVSLGEHPNNVKCSSLVGESNVSNKETTANLKKACDRSFHAQLPFLEEAITDPVIEEPGRCNSSDQVGQREAPNMEKKRLLEFPEHHPTKKSKNSVDEKIIMSKCISSEANTCAAAGLDVNCFKSSHSQEATDHCDEDGQNILQSSVFRSIETRDSVMIVESNRELLNESDEFKEVLNSQNNEPSKIVILSEDCNSAETTLPTQPGFIQNGSTVDSVDVITNRGLSAVESGENSCGDSDVEIVREIGFYHTGPNHCNKSSRAECVSKQTIEIQLSPSVSHVHSEENERTLMKGALNAQNCGDGGAKQNQELLSKGNRRFSREDIAVGGICKSTGDDVGERTVITCDKCHKTFADADGLAVHKHVWGKLPCNMNRLKSTNPPTEKTCNCARSPATKQSSNVVKEKFLCCCRRKFCSQIDPSRHSQMCPRKLVHHLQLHPGKKTDKFESPNKSSRQLSVVKVEKDEGKLPLASNTLRLPFLSSHLPPSPLLIALPVVVNGVATWGTLALS